MGTAAAEMAAGLPADAIVSDVGSSKSSVARALERALPGIIAIPAHPVAGTEHSGPDSGFAELFINRWCILTPPPDADPAAVEKLAIFALRGLSADWDSAEASDDEMLVNSLAMLLPLSPEEKQALLECATLAERRMLLDGLMEYALCGGDNEETIQ